MFWKNKKKTEELFYIHSTGDRVSFRVVPFQDEPIRMQFGGKPITIKDIGAVGLSFCQQDFQTGQVDHIAFQLPGEEDPITAQAEIVDIDKDGTCHCRFLNLDEEASDAIHRYMLAVQREIARKKRQALRRNTQKTLLIHTS